MWTNGSLAESLNEGEVETSAFIPVSIFGTKRAGPDDSGLLVGDGWGNTTESI